MKHGPSVCRLCRANIASEILAGTQNMKQGCEFSQTFSLTIGDASLHLISYYKIEDVENCRLRSLPVLALLNIGTHQKSKFAPMVLHAAVQKLTTWKALLLLFQLHYPQKFPFSLKVASQKIQDSANQRSIPTVLPQAKEELRRTQRQTCTVHLFFP